MLHDKDIQMLHDFKRIYKCYMIRIYKCYMYEEMSLIYTEDMSEFITLIFCAMFLEFLNDKMRVLLVYEHTNSKGIGKIYSFGAILTFILGSILTFILGSIS